MCAVGLFGFEGLILDLRRRKRIIPSFSFVVLLGDPPVLRNKPDIGDISERAQPGTEDEGALSPLDQRFSRVHENATLQPNNREEDNGTNIR